MNTYFDHCFGCGVAIEVTRCDVCGLSFPVDGKRGRCQQHTDPAMYFNGDALSARHMRFLDECRHVCSRSRANWRMRPRHEPQMEFWYLDDQLRLFRIAKDALEGRDGYETRVRGHSRPSISNPQDPHTWREDCVEDLIYKNGEPVFRFVNRIMPPFFLAHGISFLKVELGNLGRQVAVP